MFLLLLQMMSLLLLMLLLPLTNQDAVVATWSYGAPLVSLLLLLVGCLQRCKSKIKKADFLVGCLQRLKNKMKKVVVVAAVAFAAIVAVVVIAAFVALVATPAATMIRLVPLFYQKALLAMPAVNISNLAIDHSISQWQLAKNGQQQKTAYLAMMAQSVIDQQTELDCRN